jgi:hypothetical protein
MEEFRKSVPRELSSRAGSQIQFKESAVTEHPILKSGFERNGHRRPWRSPLPMPDDAARSVWVGAQSPTVGVKPSPPGSPPLCSRYFLRTKAPVIS